MIKTCNHSGKILAPIELANIGDVQADVFVDTSKFSNLNNIKKAFGYCTVEPGITLLELNKSLINEEKSI